MRNHCDCGEKLPPKPEAGTGNWGDWKCQKCGSEYCQDCGSLLDPDSSECLQWLDEYLKDVAANEPKIVR